VVGVKLPFKLPLCYRIELPVRLVERRARRRPRQRARRPDWAWLGDHILRRNAGNRCGHRVSQRRGRKNKNLFARDDRLEAVQRVDE